MTTFIGLELAIGEQRLRVRVQADSYEEAEARTRTFLTAVRGEPVDDVDIEIVEVKHQ